LITRPLKTELFFLRVFLYLFIGKQLLVKHLSMKKPLLFSAIILGIPFMMSAQTSGAGEYEAAHPELSGLDSVDYPGYVYYHAHGEHPTREAHDSPMRYEPSAGAPLFMNNAGFEAMNFYGWTGTIGWNTVSSAGPLQTQQQGIYTGQINPPLSSGSTQHSIMYIPGAPSDPIGGFATVPPGHGSCTALLGSSYGQYQGQSIEQTWVVGLQDTAFTFSFAVVMYDATHGPNEGSYFEYELVDSLGIVLFSRHDESVSTLSFYQNAGADNYYLNWHYDTLNLTPFIGQSVTIRFTTAGCIWGGHWCYAYVDCDPFNANTIGIDEFEKFKINVYPNPSANGVYYLTCEDNASAEIPVVYDMSGRIIDATITRTATGWMIDIAQTSKGTYLAQIHTANGVKHCHLIH
jgi:hypothetical protein